MNSYSFHVTLLRISNNSKCYADSISLFYTPYKIYYNMINNETWLKIYSCDIGKYFEVAVIHSESRVTKTLVDLDVSWCELIRVL